MMMKRIRLLTIMSLLALVVPIEAQDMPTGEELIQRVEDLMRSDSVINTMEMEIVTPDWRRTLKFRSYDDRKNDRSFIHILAPARDENTTFLRLQRQLWSYLPRAERTMKIPPSMMLQSWMGSDFTNDDLVRESDYIDDFEQEMKGLTDVEGVECYHLVMIPTSEAKVTWGRIDIFVSIEPFAPKKYEYYDRRGDLRKIMMMSEIKEMDGRLIPTRWEMNTINKPDHATILTLQNITFDPDISDRIFSKQYLRNPR